MVVGVLTQYLVSWHWPVAYLSKQLDSIAKGWLPCLQALAATALLVSEAEKLTLEGEITVRVPHLVVLKAEALAPCMSAQKTDFIALTRARQLAAEKTVNIYIDSKYAFYPSSGTWGYVYTYTCVYIYIHTHMKRLKIT
jgi:hypothetical protein